MCKSANVRKTVVHKMRKSAAQIIFQMQKSQICTVHKTQMQLSAHVTISEMQNSQMHKIIFIYESFFCAQLFFLYS